MPKLKDNKSAWLVPVYTSYDGLGQLIKTRLQYMPIKERRKITVFTFDYDNTIIPYGYTVHIIANKIFNNLKEDNLIDGTLFN